MNRFRTLYLLILLILGAVTVSAQETTPTEEPEATSESTSDTTVPTDAVPVITLERTACFGSCPIYTVAIYSDGTVVYNGERFVEMMGEHTSEIDPEVVAQMVQVFEDAGYFEWDEAYDTMTVSDLPYINTSVTRDGETHSIHRYTGDDSAPLALPFLEHWIDIMARTSLWTGVPFEISTVSNGEDTPVATLEQTPCYGLCPVYSVALYADGTIVYLGIANVTNFGVHVFETEPAAIESILARAAAIGYFNLADNYDQMMMTDQSSVITSLRTDAQFKRINRYGGDPSAPVGLLWIEEAISETVNFAMQ